MEPDRAHHLRPGPRPEDNEVHTFGHLTAGIESFRGLRGDPRYLDLVDRLGLRTFWDQRDWPEDALVE